MNLLNIVADIKNRLTKVEKKTWLRFATVKEIDCEGTAEWNIKKFRPGALAVMHDKGDLPLPACRIQAIGATKDSGIWWPPSIGEKVAVVSLETWDAPVIMNSRWGNGAEPPEGADQHKVIIKWKGHIFTLDATPSKGGILINTAAGVKIYLYDGDGGPELLLEHPGGTYVKLDKDGNYEVFSMGCDTHNAKKDFIVDAKGSIDMLAGESVGITAGTDVNIKGANINLEIVGALMGVLTQASHGYCYLMGTPIMGHPNIKGG